MQLKEIKKTECSQSLILCVAYGYKEKQFIKAVYKLYNFDICYALIVHVKEPVTQNWNIATIYDMIHKCTELLNRNLW